MIGVCWHSDSHMACALFLVIFPFFDIKDGHPVDSQLHTAQHQSIHLSARIPLDLCRTSNGNYLLCQFDHLLSVTSCSAIVRLGALEDQNPRWRDLAGQEEENQSWSATVAQQRASVPCRMPRDVIHRFWLNEVSRSLPSSTW